MIISHDNFSFSQSTTNIVDLIFPVVGEKKFDYFKLLKRKSVCNYLINQLTQFS